MLAHDPKNPLHRSIIVPASLSKQSPPTNNHKQHHKQPQTTTNNHKESTNLVGVHRDKHLRQSRNVIALSVIEKEKNNCQSARSPPSPPPLP